MLVDDSLSMGYASGGPPAFHRAREVAGAVIGAANPQDRCTLVAASAPRTPLFHEVEGTRREELSGDALALPLADTHASWPTVLAGIDEVVQSCTYPMRNLTIITDLRKSGWDASAGDVARRWHEQGVRVRVVDVGGDEVGNVALWPSSPSSARSWPGPRPIGRRRSGMTLPGSSAAPRRSSGWMIDRPSYPCPRSCPARWRESP